MLKIKNLIKNCSPDREYLLHHLLGLGQAQLLLATNKTVSATVLKKLRILEKQRTLGVPLQYLAGHAWFYGLDLIVNRNVLIPRPETELLVEQIIANLANAGRVENKIALFDLGTGSGCVAIALAKNLPDTRTVALTATDISAAALRVARINARRQRVKIKFKKSALLDSVIWPRIDKIFIAANLPYLSARRLKNLSNQVRREPRQALNGGRDGLDLYKRLLRQIKSRYRAGQTILLWFEINPEQKNKLTRIATREFPAAQINFYSDLHGDTRLAKIVLIN